MRRAIIEIRGEPVLNVGIVTLYVGRRRRIEERKFLVSCIREGKKLGLEVVVFTPEDVREGKWVLAHLYDSGARRWFRARRAIPEVIYDRCRFQTGGRFWQMSAFRRKYRHLKFINHPLGHKGRVEEVLRREARIAPHLPETQLLRSSETLLTMCRRHRELYIKPVNGTGGRGIMRLRKVSDLESRDNYLLEGRGKERQMMAPQRGTIGHLATLVMRRCRGQKYLVQQGIDIRLTGGNVHDYRLVVQKDGAGEWTWTGGAARIGRRGSVTSNLHGGGRALSLNAMLQRNYSNERIAGIRDSLRALSLRIARHLESHYGRLCELGLDVAIDRNGHPWLLEINPKPAREIFARTSQHKRYLTAIRRPLEFARWLYSQT